MDANGTRYHLLLGRNDWAKCTLASGMTLHEAWETKLPTADLEWEKDRSELTLEKLVFQFTTNLRDRQQSPPVEELLLPIEGRRGAARDQFENWYWIDESGSTILVRSSGSSQTTRFWSADDVVTCEPAPRYGDFEEKFPTTPPTPLRLQGLCVTDQHYLVVGQLHMLPKPASLLIFDLYAGGVPREMQWPDSVPFEPWDMSANTSHIFILDRANDRYWMLDCYFNVVRREQTETTVITPGLEDFQPTDGTEEKRAGYTFPQGITLAYASPIDAADPISIAAFPDSTVLILDGVPVDGFSMLYRYQTNQRIGTFSTDVMRTAVEETHVAHFKLRGYDLAFIATPPPAEGETPSPILGQVYITEARGNQSFAFNLLQDALEPLRDYYPMRLFGGKALVAAGSMAYYDFEDRWIPLIKQSRPRYAADGELFSPFFDSREPDCVWHRLLIDACIPPETDIFIATRTANERALLPFAEWHDEPLLYRRGDGSELPYAPPTGYNTYELLFQRAHGQYMQIRVRLQGNQQSTPHIRALRAYYPRFSYLTRYLPAVYRQDAASASFVDRFLANFEGMFTTLEDKIAAVQVLFDIRSVPQEALDWLAGWFGVVFDDAWKEEETRKRLFIQHAMQFFQMRGTVAGLSLALQLALDPCPTEAMFHQTVTQREKKTGIRIIENFRTRQTPAAVLGDTTAPPGLIAVIDGPRWRLDEGSEGLHKRYANYVKTLIAIKAIPKETPIPTVYPLARPTDALAAALWQQFSQDVVGFVPSATRTQAALWESFLTRRYQTIKALNDVYQPDFADFAAVPLPSVLPTGREALRDWAQFESIVLGMQRNAHRFSVLLPQASYLDDDAQQQRLEVARRVVELEKPAHTTFEIKFYWALFRVGGVRVGYDTVLGQGSRAPELMAALVLGRGALMEGYLTSTQATRPGSWQTVS